MDWSSDGRFILYEQDDLTGEKRSLWALPITRREATPRPYTQTPFNAYMGRISPDSRWAAFQSDETGRYEVYVDTFPEPRGKVRISTAGGMLPRWTAGGNEVLYVSSDFTLMGVTVRLSPRPEVSLPERLFSLPVVDPDLSPYEVSSDGKRFLVLELVKHRQPITVILNWPALVR